MMSQRKYILVNGVLHSLFLVEIELLQKYFEEAHYERKKCNDQRCPDSGIRGCCFSDFSICLRCSEQQSWYRFWSTPILTVGTFHPGNPDLCRPWNPVFPCLLQTEGTCFPGFILRFPRRIFHGGKSGYLALCKYDDGRKTSLCLWRYS